MPVRLFTYLVGKDSGSAENLHNMACQNKGYYAQINSPEDAKQKILEYGLVMARPMVLYQADHPVHWSPVFVGGYSSLLGRDNEGKRKLVTTVSTPVFDRRNHSVRVANLLGVVGTDVPIEEIQKVIPRHKLGANGYSFIVDNNGRLLYHPDLRPLTDNGQYMSMLKPKYHSIDLTETEVPEIELLNVNNPGNSHDRMDENTQALFDVRNIHLHFHNSSSLPFIKFRLLPDEARNGFAEGRRDGTNGFGALGWYEESRVAYSKVR